MIIWDKQLTQPLGLIADYRVLKVRNYSVPFDKSIYFEFIESYSGLKERGVEKMMDLRDLKEMTVLKKKDVQDMAHIFFIVKPKLELMSLIAQNIHSL